MLGDECAGIAVAGRPDLALWAGGDCVRHSEVTIEALAATHGCLVLQAHQPDMVTVRDALPDP